VLVVFAASDNARYEHETGIFISALLMQESNKRKSRTRHGFLTKSYMFRLYEQALIRLLKIPSYVFRLYKQAVVRLLCSTVTFINLLKKVCFFIRVHFILGKIK
jgi:hypothetical protein